MYDFAVARSQVASAKSHIFCLVGLPLLLVALPCRSAELPPAIQADRYWLQANRQIHAEQYGVARATLDDLLALSEAHGLELPAAFWYANARVFLENGKFDQAIESATRHLVEIGRGGESYTEALELLDMAEQARQDAQTEERRRRSALEARQREREAARRRLEEELTEELALAARMADESQPVDRDVLRSGGLGPEMVRLPGGGFCWDVEGQLLASPGTRRSPCRFWVTISKPFSIGKFEVTVGEFRRFVEATGYRTGRGCRDTWNSDMERDGGAMRRSWRRPGYRQTDDHPVVCVNGDDIAAYAEWLSRETGQRYRLPSQAEWDYAANGGQARDFGCSHRVAGSALMVLHPERDTEWEPCRPQICSHLRSNICQKDKSGPSLVGQYKPNPVGLYDMFGNVAELVEDCQMPRTEARAEIPDGSPWIGDGVGGACRRGMVTGSHWQQDVYWVSDDRDRKWDQLGRRNMSAGFRLVRELD